MSEFRIRIRFLFGLAQDSVPITHLWFNCVWEIEPIFCKLFIFDKPKCDISSFGIWQFFGVVIATWNSSRRKSMRILLPFFSTICDRKTFSFFFGNLKVSPMKSYAIAAGCNKRAAVRIHNKHSISIDWINHHQRRVRLPNSQITESLNTNIAWGWTDDRIINLFIAIKLLFTSDFFFPSSHMLVSV